MIAQELHARSRELGLTVREISPHEVRRIVVGNPYAKKLEVAQALARQFPEIRPRLPAAAPHRVLGYRPRDKYWLHMFDALAVATAIDREPL